MKQVLCPTCSTSVEWSDKSPWRPFCSERCKLIDLGEWFAENHRIASPEDEFAAHEFDTQAEFGDSQNPERH
ncbi:MAG: DNA gyrase inhibitor YacG [Gammaproteobacteria bacterium]|nr:DNA gyrase inhibitor YacG [Gammaproteobacteria bacterium]